MIIVSDSFNRADSTTTLGNADTGQTWIVQEDTNNGLTPVWGIISNTAYDATPTANGQDIAWIESGVSDATVVATISAIDAGSDVGLTFRFVDRQNYYLLVCDNTAPEIAVYKNVANAFTLLNTSVFSVSSGDVISVVLNGTAITTKQNGTTRNNFTDSTFLTGTKHGLRQFGSATIGRFDNFSVTTPSDGFLLVKN